GRFMEDAGIADEEFAAIPGPGDEGTLMTFGTDARKRPEAKDIVAKFRAKNFEPQAYTLYSYAAVQVIKQAAEAAKSLDPKKVAAQIKSGQKFKTVIGDISYDKKGDVTRIDYTVYVWKKDPSGKITYTEIECRFCPRDVASPPRSEAGFFLTPHPRLCSTGNVSIRQLLDCVNTPARKPM